MQDRLNQNDVTNRVNVEDPQRVRDAVLALFAARYPGENLIRLARAFDDFRALFEGRFSGYFACDTLYHDIRHSPDVTLAMARLIDGHERSCAPSDQLGARRAMLGVLVALLHDAGYMKRRSETEVANGAVFTKIHVSRSADFISAYLPRLGFSAEVAVAAQLVHFTGYEMEIEDIHVADPKDRLVGCLVGTADLIGQMSDGISPGTCDRTFARLVGCLVGTADLIGQMSDRMYLEKCRQFLYREFVLGNIARERLPDGREVVRYASGDDLIVKTPGFYEYVARDRIDRKLGAVIRYAEAHFDGPNLYQSEIDRNMGFLRRAISTADLSRLRRYCYSLSEPVRRAA